MTNYVGKVLIAHPNLGPTETFHRTVIYIYQDDPKAGSLGVITNKKSRYNISDLAADKNITFGDSTKFVYHGGPVNQQALVLLHTNDWASTNTAPAGRSLCVSSDDLMLEKLNTGIQPAYWRLFGGMCGWAPGQLDAEMNGVFPFRSENSWLIAQAPEQCLFGTDGDKQWQKCFELSSAQMFAKFW